MRKILKEQEQTPIEQAIQSSCLKGGRYEKTATSSNHPNGVYIIPLSGKKYNDLGQLDETGEQRKVYFYNDNQFSVEINGKLVLVRDANGRPKTWNCGKIDSTDVFNDLYKKFGILENRDKNDILRITNILQKQFVDKGAVSAIFPQWNKMLYANYPEILKTNGLRRKDGSGVKLGLPEEGLMYLKTKFGSQPSIEPKQQYGWDVEIWVPQGSTPSLSSTVIEKSEADCKRILEDYLKSAFDYLAGKASQELPELLQYRKDIKACDGNGKYDNYRGLNKYDEQGNLNLKVKEKLQPFGPVDKNLSYKDIKKLLRGEKVHGVSINIPTNYFLNLESKEMGLKSMIKENLLEVSKSKKEKQIIENKIIKTRFGIISENVDLKSKKQKDSFFRNLVSEMNYLNKQGFQKSLIKESFWDILAGLLGDDKEMVAVNFKHKYADWLLKQLTGDERGNMIASKLKEVIDNISTDDIHKITDCNFISKKLTDAIVDESIHEVKDEPTPNSPIHKAIKDIKIEKMSDEDFYHSIENEVMSILCPKLGDIKNKMGDKADEIKYKALFT